MVRTWEPWTDASLAAVVEFGEAVWVFFVLVILVHLLTDSHGKSGVVLANQVPSCHGRLRGYKWAAMKDLLFQFRCVTALRSGGDCKRPVLGMEQMNSRSPV